MHVTCAAWNCPHPPLLARYTARNRTTPRVVVPSQMIHPKSFGRSQLNNSSRAKMFKDNIIHNLHVPMANAMGGNTGGNNSDANPPAIPMPPMHAMDSPKSRFSLLATLNESTKFLVAGTAVITLITHPNVSVVWCLIGSVVNSAFGKILKKILNKKRPSGALKADPGMPSSHAVSLSYLSVYSALSLLLRGGLGGGALFGPGFLGPNHPAWPVAMGVVEPLAIGLLLTGIVFTWLRVTLGYHTFPQVLVGYILGAFVASGWLFVGETILVPLANMDQRVMYVLYATCLVTSVLFAKLAVKWVNEVKLWRKAKSKTV